LETTERNDSSILWQQLKTGNVDALGHLYDRFVDELFAYASTITMDRQKGMDAIHDLFFNLYKYRNNLANTDNVEAYLRRSLKNQLIKKHTAGQELMYIPNHLFFEGHMPSANIPSHEQNLIEAEFFDERSMRLSEALGVLSKKQKQGIFLRFNENRQYEEIAEIMDISVQTSRTLIYRAIKVLRGNLTLFIIIYQIFLYFFCL